MEYEGNTNVTHGNIVELYIFKKLQGHTQFFSTLVSFLLLSIICQCVSFHLAATLAALNIGKKTLLQTHTQHTVYITKNTQYVRWGLYIAKGRKERGREKVDYFRRKKKEEEESREKGKKKKELSPGAMRMFLNRPRKKKENSLLVSG